MKFATLLPPHFTEFGEPLDIDEAIGIHAWIASVNVWIVNNRSIVYQQRSVNKLWAPGKLDVIIGGKVDEGEDFFTAAKREGKEEVGIEIDDSKLKFIEKRLHVGTSSKGYINTVNHVYLLEDSIDLEQYKMVDGEVDAIFSLSIDELIKMWESDNYTFIGNGIDVKKKEVKLEINKSLFPENWDNYHYKAVLKIKEILSKN